MLQVFWHDEDAGKAKLLDLENKLMFEKQFVELRCIVAKISGERKGKIVAQRIMAETLLYWNQILQDYFSGRVHAVS